MKVRDRIVDFQRIPAGEICPHPKNWRHHSDQQKKVTSGLLSEIGIFDVALVYFGKFGLTLLDGHMRVDLMAPGDEVPCLVLDVSDEEAETILATHDAIGDLAGLKREKLDELLSRVKSKNPHVNALLKRLSSQKLETAAAPQPPAAPAAPLVAEPPPDLLNAYMGDGSHDGEHDDDSEVEDEEDVLPIPGSGEKYNKIETIRFRGWAIPTTPESADLLAKKFKQHYDQFGSSLGLAERIIEAIPGTAV